MKVIFIIRIYHEMTNQFFMISYFMVNTLYFADMFFNENFNNRLTSNKWAQKIINKGKKI